MRIFTVNLILLADSHTNQGLFCTPMIIGEEWMESVKGGIGETRTASFVIIHLVIIL